MDELPPAERTPEDEPATPTSHGPAPKPGAGSTGGPSRRGFLVGASIAVVTAAGVGVALGVRREPHHSTRTPTPPAALLAALSAEGALIAQLDASMAANPARRGVLAQLRANHVAHQSALRASVEFAFDGATPSAETSPSPSATARPANAGELRTAEMRASALAAARAARLSGRDATLLASIAACEATHVVLLS